MQCVNCQFENMPGLSACVRCGSSLTHHDIELEPPRAPRYRIHILTRRSVYRLRHALPTRSSLAHILNKPISLQSPADVPLRVIVWSIIPGLGHIKTRHRIIGWTLLSVWSVLLILSVLDTNPWWQSVFYNGAITTHVLAFLLLLATSLSYDVLLLRALFGIVVFLLLRLFLYAPLTYLGSSLYKTQTIPPVIASRVLQEGDLLLREGPWLRPESFNRGDLVVYEIPCRRGSGYVIEAGSNIDRIIGLPGDRVRAVGGQVYVNEEVPPEGFGPITTPNLGEYEIDVPRGTYLILPSFLHFRGYPRNPQLEQEVRDAVLDGVVLVPYDNIVGRVRFRIRPLSRFGTLR